MWSGSSAVINAPESITAMAQAMREAGSKPELEVFDSGDIQLAKMLIGKGVLDSPAMFQIVTGIRFGFEQTPQTMAYARSLLPADAVWAGFGIGRMAFLMVAQAFLLGGHVRVGLEDADMAAQPERFAAFASITLQYPDLAVQQLDGAVRKQGLRGAAINASVLGESFAQPRFDPVWAKVEELGAVLFVHPQSTPELAKRFAGNGWVSNLIGNPLDTTLALQHLIFEGTLDRFPGLKLLAAHGGGYLGSYAPRSDHACFISPQNCNPAIVLKKQPTEYLNQLYLDSLVFTPEGLRHLAAQVGASLGFIRKQVLRLTACLVA